MKTGRSLLVVSAGVALAATFSMAGRADNDGDKKAPQDVVVQFGAPQPQPSPASATHFLAPDDVTVGKGGTVTFVVNGGGHGLAIYPVSKDTTRQDISEDLCQGGPTVCNGAAATGDPDNPVGTQNLRYQISDGKNRLVIDTDTGAHQPRVDDPSKRLVATSGTIPGQPVTAGAFVVGTTPTAVGNRIQYRFTKTGRFLVICMNRGHLLNDWMFGFVNVVGGDGDDDQG
jgi:plastocyanin